MPIPAKEQALEDIVVTYAMLLGVELVRNEQNTRRTAWLSWIADGAGTMSFGATRVKAFRQWLSRKGMRLVKDSEGSYKIVEKLNLKG